VDVIFTELEQFSTCIILLLSVTCIRSTVAFIIGKVLRKEVPPAMIFPMWEGPVFLTQFLAICDSMAGIITSKCVWHRALAYVIFGVLPVSFMIFAIVRLRKHINDKTLIYLKRPQPSLKEIWKKGKTTKGFFPKILYFYGAHKNRNFRGDWNDDNPTARKWAFVIASYTGFAWLFAVYCLFRKLLLALILNVLEARDNAISMLALQSLDTLLIIVYRPFSEGSTLQQEITGGITNLLAVTSICVPVVSGGTIPWPDWMNDSFTLITGLFATVMGAIFSMIAAVSSLVAPFTTLVTMCLGCCSCFTSIKVAPSAEGGIPTDIPVDVVPEDVPTDELVDTAAENVQGEIDAQQADLVVGYDEKDPFEMEEEGSPPGDEEEGNEEVEGVNAGVIGVGIAAAAATAAYHNYRHDNRYSSLGYRLHAIITITFNIDYTSVGEEGSNERAIFNNDLIRDLTAASPGLPPECFEILKLTSEGIPPSKDSSTVATSSWQNAMLFLEAPFRWATRKKVNPNLSSGGSLVAEIAIVTQSNNPADVSNVSENLLQQRADPASTLRSGKLTQAIISILIQDSEGNVIPRSQHVPHSQVYQIGTTTHTPRSQVHRLQDEVDIIIHGKGKVCTPPPQENGNSHPFCKKDDYHTFEVEEHSPSGKNDGAKLPRPPPYDSLEVYEVEESSQKDDYHYLALADARTKPLEK
jgi:hypothetical protein